jgi:hypothetical protein
MAVKNIESRAEKEEKLNEAQKAKIASDAMAKLFAKKTQYNNKKGTIR